MKKKTKNVLSACTVASVLITSSVAAVNVKAAEVTTLGNETAVKVSQAGGASNSDYEVKANGKELKISANSSDNKKGNNGEQNLRLFDTVVSNWVQYVEQKHPQGLHAIADVSESNHKLTIKLVNPNETLYGAYSKFVDKYNLQNALGKAQNILFDETNGYAVTKVIKVSDGNKAIYDANSQDKTVSTLLESVLSLNDLQDTQALKSIQYKSLKGTYKVYLKYKGEDISTPYIVKVD